MKINSASILASTLSLVSTSPVNVTGPPGGISIKPSGFTVDVSGYLENACMGELLWTFNDIIFEECYSVADIRASGSIAATGFLGFNTVNFYYGDDCTTEVAHTADDECYVHSQTAVNSFKLVSSS